MSGIDERDTEGNLTDWALAADALTDNGCDCEEGEPDTCLACVCERAMRTERARAEKVEKERDIFKAEYASISAEFGLPPTIRPAEGEIRRLLDEARAKLAETEADEEAHESVSEIETCDECGHLPAIGNVVYKDSGERPLCSLCNTAVAKKEVVGARDAEGNRREVMTTYEKYCANLRAQMDSITPGALAICRAWHGETFGTPGYGGETWVACEIGRANIAIRALDALRTGREEEGRMNKLRVHTVPNGKLDAKGQDLRVDLVDEDGREHLFPVQSLVLRCAGRCKPVVIEVVVAQRDIEVDVTGNSGVLDFEGKEGKD